MGPSMITMFGEEPDSLLILLKKLTYASNKNVTQQGSNRHGGVLPLAANISSGQDDSLRGSSERRNNASHYFKPAELNLAPPGPELTLPFLSRGTTSRSSQNAGRSEGSKLHWRTGLKALASCWPLAGDCSQPLEASHSSSSWKTDYFFKPVWRI
ncbi:uncharacterized protein [Ovis canadensis]|uniref:uncharacterized protein isoform X2 n=1 Tax=Ovis canadensis TaxID=37174 RepID=UPI0037510765